MTRKKLQTPLSDETLFYYCMEKAAYHPQAFLEAVKAKDDPAYWEEFWAFYASIRVKDDVYKQQMVDKYTSDDADAGDFNLLLAYEKYLEFCASTDDAADNWYLSTACDFLCLAEEGMSPLLHDAFDAIYSLVYVPQDDDDDWPEEVNNIYTQYIFVYEERITLEGIRRWVHEVQPVTDWQHEIAYLCRRMEWNYIDAMLHEPDGWEGVKWIKTEPFVLHEDGKTLSCLGLWQVQRGQFDVYLQSDEAHPHTLPLGELTSVESYKTIVLALLAAVDAYDAWAAELMGE